MKIITHPHLDLDAASSVCLLIKQGHCTLEEVGFVPANAARRPRGLEHAFYVDHPLGVKGKQSALAELPDSRAVLGDDFVDEVSQQDSSGSADPRFSLGQIFAAGRAAHRARGLAGEALDRALLAWWLILIEGIALQQFQLTEAETKVIQQVQTGELPVVAAGGFLWAVPKGPMPPLAGIVLNKQLGVTGVLYQASYGLGIHRYRDHHEPNLTMLKGRLPGWFIHPNGFMVCWGSRKAPRHEPPPEGTPQDQKELLQLLKEVLEKWQQPIKRAKRIYGWPKRKVSAA